MFDLDRPFDMIMASGQMTLGCSKEGDLYAWGQIGGRNELVPVQYAVECERHRDLLRRGMTVDTGGMVSAGNLQTLELPRDFPRSLWPF